jgi:acyl-homoserine lactone acylase PvdQ
MTARMEPHGAAGEHSSTALGTLPFPASIVRWLLVASLLATPSPGRAQAPEAMIHRDAWGVPHVFSETDAGVVFGMAWALAEDDWALIEENYLQALGRRAELMGDAAVAGDWMARALKIAPLSVAEYESAAPRMRELLDAFATGMNRWLESRPPEEVRVLDRIEPWYPLALIMVAFGPAVRAASILNYGQSGDPASAHFFDQAMLYAQRRFKPAWFDRADVEANAVRSYSVR